jgi:hypothetical protein
VLRAVQPASETRSLLQQGSQVMYQGTHSTLTGSWQRTAAADYSTFLGPCTFEWFCTFTFKDRIHPEAAEKAFRVWINKLNNHLYGRKWRNRAPDGVTWVRGLEWQKRGVIHYHVLLSGALGAVPSIWSDVWHLTMGMGFADIVPLKDNQEAVKAYVTKYVCKGGELDFSGNFRKATKDWINSLAQDQE